MALWGQHMFPQPQLPYHHLLFQLGFQLDYASSQCRMRGLRLEAGRQAGSYMYGSGFMPWAGVGRP